MGLSQGIETEGAGCFNHVNDQAWISKITQRVLYYDILSLQKKAPRDYYTTKQAKKRLAHNTKQEAVSKQMFDTASLC